MVLLRLYPIRIQLIFVSALEFAEFRARLGDFFAVLVIHKARGPPACGSIWSVHADLGFRGANAGASSGINHSIDLGELVIQELAVFLARYIDVSFIARI